MRRQLRRFVLERLRDLTTSEDEFEAEAKRLLGSRAMSRWIGDGTLAHLRDVAEWPDLGERYEVTGRLGRGGMGVVYAARDRVLDREVAIKVLDTRILTLTPRRRLQDEARILGAARASRASCRSTTPARSPTAACFT